ncbi:hypothetical protein ACFXNW_05890 [Nocardia sp. NPDC059180]|uniref:hypothetical protein n=1 Tax=Nocardia sp. NPDC059180 TaxID=3346761 RepID=UPI0036BFFD76
MKRVTISVPDDVAEAAAAAVNAGEFASVSAYFAAASGKLGDWLAARAALDEMITEAGGLSDADRAAAAEMMTEIARERAARKQDVA